MIKTKNVKSYCKSYTEIENYESAIADTTQTWECHHRLETHTSDGEKRLVSITQKELKALDMYYNRPPEELIFLTAKDHLSLHHKGRTSPNKGKHMSEEAKKKISNAHKGKKLSEETKQRISDAHKGKKNSEEAKRKMSAAHKGKKRGSMSEETKQKISEARKAYWAKRKEI